MPFLSKRHTKIQNFYAKSKYFCNYFRQNRTFSSASSASSSAMIIYENKHLSKISGRAEEENKIDCEK